MEMVLRIFMIVLGIVLLGKTFVSLAKRILTEHFGMLWGFFSVVLILAGITGNLFDQVLYTLRKAGTPVDYKAVLTEHNQNWNCMQLYKELEKEHNMYHPS